MMKIFISYATVDLDKFQISKVVDILERQDDIEQVYYWDRDCNSFESIIKYMENAIMDSDVVISFNSPNSKELVTPKIS